MISIRKSKNRASQLVARELLRLGIVNDAITHLSILPWRMET